MEQGYKSTLDSVEMKLNLKLEYAVAADQRTTRSATDCLTSIHLAAFRHKIYLCRDYNYV